MIKKALRLTILSASALLILGSGLILKTRMGNENSDPPQSPAEPSPAYTLREYDSMVGVFREESDTPEEVYTVFVRVLPEKDKLALKNGISVSTEEELRHLIEDFSG